VKLLQSAVPCDGSEMKDVKHDKVLPYTEWNEMVEEGKHDSELGRIARSSTTARPTSGLLRWRTTRTADDAACHLHHGSQVEGP
jgi:hypothetical protein